MVMFRVIIAINNRAKCHIDETLTLFLLSKHPQERWTIHKISGEEAAVMTTKRTRSFCTKFLRCLGQDLSFCLRCAFEWRGNRLETKMVVDDAIRRYEQIVESDEVSCVKMSFRDRLDDNHAPI